MRNSIFCDDSQAYQYQLHVQPLTKCVHLVWSPSWWQLKVLHVEVRFGPIFFVRQCVYQEVVFKLLFIHICLGPPSNPSPKTSLIMPWYHLCSSPLVLIPLQFITPFRPQYPFTHQVHEWYHGEWKSHNERVKVFESEA